MYIIYDCICHIHIYIYIHTHIHTGLPPVSLMSSHHSWVHATIFRRHIRYGDPIKAIAMDTTHGQFFSMKNHPFLVLIIPKRSIHDEFAKSFE